MIGSSLHHNTRWPLHSQSSTAAHQWHPVSFPAPHSAVASKWHALQLTQSRPLAPTTRAAGAIPMMASWAFKPLHAIAGGVCIGTLSAGTTSTCGRILGISGTVKGIVRGSFDPWRFLLVAGLVAGGITAAALFPGSFDVLPASYTLQRAVTGGVLVGAGAAMGNGCTSGHGIAGNARLSLRSLVFTAVFFACGIASCKAFGTLDALGVPSTAPDFVSLQGADLKQAAALVATTTAATALAAWQARGKASVLFARAYSLASGALFALGLAFSGMTRPSIVAACLGLVNFQLMFVMAGALAVSLPVFQFFVAKRDTALNGAALCLPATRTLDRKLLVGGALFGTGWGLSGLCPGPALVALAQPQQQTVAFVAAMIAAMGAVEIFESRDGAAASAKVA